MKLLRGALEYYGTVQLVICRLPLNGTDDLSFHSQISTLINDDPPMRECVRGLVSRRCRQIESRASLTPYQSTVAYTLAGIVVAGELAANLGMLAGTMDEREVIDTLISEAVEMLIQA